MVALSVLVLDVARPHYHRTINSTPAIFKMREGMWFLLFTNNFVSQTDHITETLCIDCGLLIRTVTNEICILI